MKVTSHKVTSNTSNKVTSNSASEWVLLGLRELREAMSTTLIKLSSHYAVSYGSVETSAIRKGEVVYGLVDFERTSSIVAGSFVRHRSILRSGFRLFCSGQNKGRKKKIKEWLPSPEQSLARIIRVLECAAEGCRWGIFAFNRYTSHSVAVSYFPLRNFGTTVHTRLVVFFSKVRFSVSMPIRKLVDIINVFFLT